MPFQDIFKRYEIKYFLNERQLAKLKERMQNFMRGDEYGRSVICNIYYDTPDYLLIRRSLDRPVYKEKLRVRSYGVSRADDTVFVELKKKYEGIVYKRRISMAENVSRSFMNGYVAGFTPHGKLDEQIAGEIQYALSYYKDIAPTIYISYEREAFFCKDDMDLRITFDGNALYRTYDLDLKKGVYGNPLFPAGMCLMEIKTASALPMWLTEFLTEERLYKTSFSKYGNAYTETYKEQKTGGIMYA